MPQAVTSNCKESADGQSLMLCRARIRSLLPRKTVDVLRLSVPQVMGQNGVSHQVVADDLEGVKAVLAWLAYAPPQTGAAPPPLPTSDPIGRTISYAAPDGAHGLTHRHPTSRTMEAQHLSVTAYRNSCPLCRQEARFVVRPVVDSRVLKLRWHCMPMRNLLSRSHQAPS